MKSLNITITSTHLSCQANLLGKAFHRLRQVPDIRPEKIGPIAAAVHSNSYPLDCRKIADRLIAGLILGCF
ncbi:flagellar biosynthesis anti-sigma factor FlgM [Desulfobacca acetoxidans]|uniref:flagellar biosynthesis anti-sigma factor FlgM n=1 Tax=Desulfobacca acetoxidans TaxID=60893 RepID=UPI0002E33592